MTRINEGIHIIAAVGFTIFTADFISEGKYERATFEIGLNLALGIYPALTQRYNRARIYNTIEKMKKRNRIFK